MKEKPVSAGVQNLRNFGYPGCNKDNILTDEIYKAFFVSMLRDNKGYSSEVDDAIDELLLECGNEDGK